MKAYERLRVIGQTEQDWEISFGGDDKEPVHLYLTTREPESSAVALFFEQGGRYFVWLDDDEGQYRLYLKSRSKVLVHIDVTAIDRSILFELYCQLLDEQNGYADMHHENVMTIIRKCDLALKEQKSFDVLNVLARQQLTMWQPKKLLSDAEHAKHRARMHKLCMAIPEDSVEIPIAASIYQGDTCLSISFNRVEEQKTVLAHAECLAIAEASKKLARWRLSDCVLYSTLEPCQMCLGAIAHAGILQIYFGASQTRQTKLHRNLFERLAESQTMFTSGLLADECEAQLNRFFASRRQHH